MPVRRLRGDLRAAGDRRLDRRGATRPRRLADARGGAPLPDRALLLRLALDRRTHGGLAESGGADHGAAHRRRAEIRGGRMSPFETALVTLLSSLVAAVLPILALVLKDRIDQNRARQAEALIDTKAAA